MPGLEARTFEGTHDEASLIVTVRGDEIFGDLDVTISPGSEPRQSFGHSRTITFDRPDVSVAIMGVIPR